MEDQIKDIQLYMKIFAIAFIYITVVLIVILNGVSKIKKHKLVTWDLLTLVCNWRWDAHQEKQLAMDAHDLQHSEYYRGIAAGYSHCAEILADFIKEKGI